MSRPSSPFCTRKRQRHLPRKSGFLAMLTGGGGWSSSIGYGGGGAFPAVRLPTWSSGNGVFGGLGGGAGGSMRCSCCAGFDIGWFCCLRENSSAPVIAILSAPDPLRYCAGVGAVTTRRSGSSGRGLAADASRLCDGG